MKTEPGLAIRAARGVLWTGGGQILRQVMQIVGQLALARLLAPDDFGLLGMALVFIGIGQLLADFGIGSAIVQSKALGSKVLSTCFWVNLAVGGALMLLVLACSPLIARFYGRPDLVPLVSLLSLNLLLSALQTVPTGLLYREMRFADLARAQVLGTFAAAVTAIGLAWAGFGIWALVAQPLVGTTTVLLFAWRATGWMPRLEYSYAEARPLMQFSVALLGTNLVGYLNRNVDGLLIGRFLGAGPLGIYSMAIQIMLFPLQQVSSVIVRVLFPVLSQVQDDLTRLRSAYLKAVGTIALVTFPLMTGLFALADDFVLLAFGSAWMAMAPVLKALSWAGLLQSIGTTMGAIYLSTGNTGKSLKVSLANTPVLVLGVLSGLPWGLVGVAIGYALATTAIFYYISSQAFKIIDLPLRALHTSLARPLLSAGLMCVTLLAASTWMVDWGTAQRFSACALLGVISYSLASALVNRAQLLDVWRIVVSLKRGR